MPIELKENFLGGLDTDTSYYELNRNRYVDALNITRDAISSAKDSVVTNIIGNRLVPFNFSDPDGVIIGYVANTLRGTAIFFRYAPSGADGIYEFDKSTRTITKIFECIEDSDTNILNFNTTDKILNANIYNRPEGDLLFFLDCLGRPTTINITRFKAGEYTPVTRDIINVIKRPPLVPAACVYGNNTSVRANNLRNKLVKIQYLWVYDDYEESCLSPESAIPLPANINDDEFTNEVTNNNVINVILNSGPKNVKSVKVLAAFSEKSNSFQDFVVVADLNKSTLGVANDSPFNYDFYNDSVYPLYDVTRRSQLYDYVPTSAVCQTLPNGNVIAYGGITEGLDRELDANVDISILTVPAGSGSSTGSLTGVVVSTSTLPGVVGYKIKFTGVPATGTIVNIRLTRLSDSAVITIGTYTTLAGDTELQIRNGLAASLNSIGIAFLVAVNGDGTLQFAYFSTIYSFNSIEIIAPSGASADNSIATWPFSTQRKLGIAYFDRNGVTNGILYSAQITFPAYSENGSQQVLLPYIHLEISHIPPIWAWSYQILVTKEPTQYVYWYTKDVNTDETEFTYFDVTNMVLNATKNPTTAAVLAWEFQDGDRMRLLRNATTNAVFPDTYDAAIIGIVIDPTINNVAKVGKFVKIRTTPPFTGTDYSTNEFVIQLYRPGLQEAGDAVLTYYEIGIQGDIISPETNLRKHSGNVADQTASDPAEIDIYAGDSYFRLRTINLTETGLASYNVQDRNFVDRYISAVSNVSGRPNIIDENLKPTFFGAMIRFGEAYQSNTNINGLNQFPASSFIDLDYSQGILQRMVTRDRAVRMFQEYKVGVCPLFSQINKTPNGDNLSVVTSVLLNPVQYYEGNNGIGSAKESLASWNNADYFCDTNRGMVCRVGGNGVQQISVIAKINSWATENIPLRTGDKKIYGVYDPRSSNYIFCLEEALQPNPLMVPVQGVFNYSGSFLVGSDLETLCSSGTLQTLYYPIPFGVGTPLFTDSNLSDTYNGTYVALNGGAIYEVDPVSSEVIGQALDGFGNPASCGVGTASDYRIGNSTATVCSTEVVTLYTLGAFAIGKTMYLDSSLTTPVTGTDYIVNIIGGGDVYNLNTVTGVVGSDTTIDCNVGDAAFYKLSSESSLVCGNPQETKYTDGAFVIGGILYNDSSITTPVSGFDFVVQVSTNLVYSIDSSTGEILALVGSCDSESALYRFAISELDVCAATPTILYTSGAFAPGVTVYMDSSLVTPLTGFQYIVGDLSTNIYNLNNVTGVVGSDTGNDCP